MPWRDIHRHRIAPFVADRLADLRASGRLEIRADRIVIVTDCGGELALSIRERGTGAIMERRISRLVSAKGPQGSLARTSEPLLTTLAERGQIRADPLGIGIDVDTDSRVIDDAGRPADDLRLIAPMSRGAFWGDRRGTRHPATVLVARQTAVQRPLGGRRWPLTEGAVDREGQA
jgi:uncharacterized NAD(P)/FAD-binding protein YdhS